jgi:hypothetical protein
MAPSIQRELPYERCLYAVRRMRQAGWSVCFSATAMLKRKTG